jgi:hypothetical protein
MGFRYEVKLMRRVAAPACGPSAYTLDVLCKEFPFGKGKEFATGEKARVAAEYLARSMLDEASTVSVWRMSGNGGRGVYLKEDMNSRFTVGWQSPSAK